MQKYDVIIVGKGPAGISAALYTVRANLTTLIVGGDSSSLKNTAKIENYYGFEEPVSGKQLLDQGVRQAIRLGAEIIEDEVTAIALEDGHRIKTVKDEYAAKAVLLATGQPNIRPSIPGIREFEGKGVSYCTTCDAYFFRGKTVGILGSGNYAIQEAAELAPFTDSITIFTNGAGLNATGSYVEQAAKYASNDQPVVWLSGGATLEAIEFDDGTRSWTAFLLHPGLLQVSISHLSWALP